LLPLADGQAAHQSPGVEIELKVFKQPSRPPVDRSPVDPGADPWLVPQRQVLGDGERLDQVQLLVDDADPCRQRGGGVAEPDRLAADLDPARVRTENAAQDLDERALAGAILAAECMNLDPSVREPPGPEPGLRRIALRPGSGPRGTGQTNRVAGSVGHGSSGGMSGAKAQERKRRPGRQGAFAG
jgi:hypothetical protein